MFDLKFKVKMYLFGFFFFKMRLFLGRKSLVKWILNT